MTATVLLALLFACTQEQPKAAPPAVKLAPSVAQPAPPAAEVATKALTRLDGNSPAGAPDAKQCKTVEKTGAGCDTPGIIKAVQAHTGPGGAIGRCYLKFEKDGRRGKVSFTIGLNPDGKAGSVRVGSDAIGNQQLNGCLQMVLAGISYPPPGDKQCTVVYPFDFR